MNWGRCSFRHNKHDIRLSVIQLQSVQSHPGLNIRNTFLHSWNGCIKLVKRARVPHQGIICKWVMKSQWRQTRATQHTVHAECFSVSIVYGTLTWTTECLTCAQILVHAIALGGARTPKESLHRKLTLGEKKESLAAPGNRTCTSGVPLRRFTNWATSPTHCCVNC